MNDELKKIRSVYFIGIGGIGMSAIARFFNSQGIAVSGYDRTESELVRELETEGMKVHFAEDVQQIPRKVDLVVYTPAVPADHKELEFYRQNGYRVMKRSDVLGMITESSFNICIAGTHGKTTTTSLVAHILRQSGYGCSAFLGGISVNYETNFWAQAPDGENKRNVFVVEADEYDRSFLKLSPDVAVITAMDPDHLDIYGTAEAMEQAFIDFSSNVKPGGLLISKFGLKRTGDLSEVLEKKHNRHLTYSLENESADAFARNIRMKNGSYEFDVVVQEKRLEHAVLQMGGTHNVENAVAAITVASSLEIGYEKIRAAVESFRGVKRRFEYIIPPAAHRRVILIDDYAHHPEELKALIRGARTLFPQKKCTIIFQPHLYTRTRDLAPEFANALSLANEVVLLPIYPARELPIAGVSSEMILARMENENNMVLTKDELLGWIENDYLINVNKEFGAVLIMAGAGDIDLMVEPIKKILMKNPGI